MLTSYYSQRATSYFTMQSLLTAYRLLRTTYNLQLRRVHVAWQAGLRLRVDARAAARLEQRVLTSGAVATGLVQLRDARGGRAATGTMESGVLVEEVAAERMAPAAEGVARAAVAAGEGAVVEEEDATGAVVAVGSREWYKLLPGGMTVEVCTRAWQLLRLLHTHYLPPTPNYFETTGHLLRC